MGMPISEICRPAAARFVNGCHVALLPATVRHELASRVRGTRPGADEVGDDDRGLSSDLVSDEDASRFIRRSLVRLSDHPITEARGEPYDSLGYASAEAQTGQREYLSSEYVVQIGAGVASFPARSAITDTSWPIGSV